MLRHRLDSFGDHLDTDLLGEPKYRDQAGCSDASRTECVVDKPAVELDNVYRRSPAS